MVRNLLHHEQRRLRVATERGWGERGGGRDKFLDRQTDRDERLRERERNERDLLLSLSALGHVSWSVVFYNKLVGETRERRERWGTRESCFSLRTLKCFLIFCYFYKFVGETRERERENRKRDEKCRER